jgi:uncharacterized CHY-type Zn-finger protein
MMPFVFVCAKCGNPIYVDDGNLLLYGASRAGEPYTLLDRVQAKLNGHCPKCGRKLNSLPLNVQVKPTPQSFYKEWFWCGHCQKWIGSKEAFIDEDGRKRCPKCMHVLRVKRRVKK